MKENTIAPPVLAALLFAFLFSCSSAAADEPDIPENYNCVSCHLMLEDDVLTPPVEQWKESVHSRVGVLCHDCHGGDPEDEAMAMEPEAGFTGKPGREDIPKLCARCHADAKLMRVYNQRADQYALYKGSVHGRRLAEGDVEAATCVDCHGRHRILPVKDPKSTVARANVPATCGGCHARKEVFEKRRMPHNQLELYKKSRHYELFAKGDLLVPTCVDCHGNHGVMSPRAERVQTVCFNCHAQSAEYYKSSAHWNAYKETGEPVCITCHGNHDVPRPTVEKFTGETERDCIWCHPEDSTAYKTGLELKSLIVSTAGAVERAEGSLDEFERGAHGGFEVGDLKKEMEKAAAKVKELHTLTHKMSAEDIRKRSGEIILAADMVSGRVDDMWAEIRTRKIGLILAWLVFLGFAGALVAKSRALERRRGMED